MHDLQVERRDGFGTYACQSATTLSSRCTMRMLMRLPTAPCHSRGRQLNVVTNLFKVSRQPAFMIQQYDVSLRAGRLYNDKLAFLPYGGYKAHTSHTQVSFSDDRCKEKRLIMRYLLEKEEIFQKASVGAVYDGKGFPALLVSEPDAD